MPTSNRMSMLVSVLMVVALPLLLWPLFVHSLQKLHLSPHGIVLAGILATFLAMP